MSVLPSERLAELLRTHCDEPIVIVTGAGISHASGIPTFRGEDPDAVWAHDVTEIATRDFFEADPVASWLWCLDRFSAALDARPNAAHHAIRELQRVHRGPLSLITQNVDGLHREAGSTEVIEVHGTLRRVRCSRDGCSSGAPSGSLPRPDPTLRSFSADPCLGTLPRCSDCGETLRPHVLWFDEFYADHDDYRWPEVLAACSALRLALFVGTSFAVGVTEIVWRAATAAGAPVLSIDPGSGAFQADGIEVLACPAEEILPETMKLLVREA